MNKPASLIVFVIFKKNTSPISIIITNILAALIITLIVGGYLSLIFYVPIEYSILGVLIGSIISIAILGTIIELILIKQKIHEQIKY